jgi:hypothetical protein
VDESILTRVESHLASAEMLIEKESLREQARQILYNAADAGDTLSAIKAELLCDRLRRM